LSGARSVFSVVMVGSFGVRKIVYNIIENN
jgi:hypothetical protein